MLACLAILTLPARRVKTLLSASVRVVHLHLQLVLNIFVEHLALRSLVHLVLVSAQSIALLIIIDQLFLALEQSLQVFLVRVALVVLGSSGWLSLHSHHLRALI